MKILKFSKLTTDQVHQLAWQAADKFPYVDELKELEIILEDRILVAVKDSKHNGKQLLLILATTADLDSFDLTEAEKKLIKESDRKFSYLDLAAFSASLTKHISMEARDLIPSSKLVL